MESLLSMCRRRHQEGKLTAAELALVEEAQEVLARERLLPESIAFVTVEQLASRPGMNLGAAAALKKGFSSADPAGGTGAGAAESSDVWEQLAVGQEKMAVGQEKMLQVLEKIQHLQLQATSATRHASSITVDDLSMVESALKVTWVRRDEDGSSEVEARLADATEFKWEENIPEPSQKEEYMAVLREQVDLPPYLVWSEQVLQE